MFVFPGCRLWGICGVNESQRWLPVAWVSIHHRINSYINSVSKSFTFHSWNARDSCSSDLLLYPYLNCLSDLSAFPVCLPPFLSLLLHVTVPGSSLWSILNQTIISQSLKLKKPKKLSSFSYCCFDVKSFWIYINSTIEISKIHTAACVFFLQLSIFQICHVLTQLCVFFTCWDPRDFGGIAWQQ